MMAKEVCTFASLLVLFSISVSAKSTIDDVLSPSSLSFTRKLLLSDECLNDELLMIEDEELDKVIRKVRVCVVLLCVLWCVQYQDSAIRIFHLNLVCLCVIAFVSRMY